MLSLVTGIHHVAFAEDAGGRMLESLTDLLGLRVGRVEDAEGFVERMIPIGECWLQALEATGDGVVRRSVRRRGSGLHHIAFSVADIDAVVRELGARGARMIDTAPRAGGMGTRIAFAHPAVFDGLLVEFVEASAHAGDLGDLTHTRSP